MSIEIFAENDTSMMQIDHRENRFDFLRLLAAWLVLFSHCYPLGGWPDSEPLATTVGIDTLGGIGVAIFFVLSGYLVTLSLERSPSVGVFVRRRVVRIFPALVVACLFCLVFFGFFATSLSAKEYFWHRQTWIFLYSATAWKIQYVLPGVFDGTPLPHAVNGSLWSLPYELTCYIALVMSLWLPGQLRSKTLLVLIVMAMALILRPEVPPNSPSLRFWGMDYYHGKLGFLFALGTFFAAWRERVPIRWAAWLLPGVALFWLIPHHGLQILVFFSGLGGLILWLALCGRWLPAIPPRMGDWSYGVYLYGFPVQQFVASQGGHLHGFLTFLVTSTTITFILAGFSWVAVEKPALRWK